MHRYKNGEFYTFQGSASHNNYVDRKGVLWVSNGGNLCRYEEPFFKKVVRMGGIQKITEDNTGRLMALTLKNRTSEIFRQAGTEWELINQSNSNIPDSTEGVEILQASDGTYWFCTFGKGVAKSSDLHNWITFDTSNSILPSNFANDMVLDRDGNVLVSFLGKGYELTGILKYTGDKWINLGAPPAKIVSSPVIRDNGNLNVDWYGKVCYGMAYYDGTTWNVVDDSLRLNSLFVDYSGMVWAATNDKISLTTNDEFYKFNRAIRFSKTWCQK